MSTDRLSMVFSEQSYLINPAFTALNNLNRLTIGASYHGKEFGNLQVAGTAYSEHLHGGITGYSVVYKDGIMSHTILAAQFSKFFYIGRNWSVSIGASPEIHNYSVKNERMVLGSQLSGVSGTPRNMPTIWGVALSTGIALFSENHTIGFSAQDIFNKLTFVTEKNASRIFYNISYGGVFPIHKYRNLSNQTVVRPHFLATFGYQPLTFFYGAFYGKQHFQAGLFFCSTATDYLLGINPAAIFKTKTIKIIISVKIIPRLPSSYIIGNELFMQYDF